MKGVGKRKFEGFLNFEVNVVKECMPLIVRSPAPCSSLEIYWLQLFELAGPVRIVIHGSRRRRRPRRS